MRHRDLFQAYQEIMYVAGIPRKVIVMEIIDQNMVERIHVMCPHTRNTLIFATSFLISKIDPEFYHGTNREIC